VRHVREQGAERNHHLDTKLAREVDDHPGEGLPAQVRLDSQQKHGIALETRNACVVEGVLGPLNLPRAALDERDVRPRRLEVEEALRLDVGEPLGRPGLREVAAGKRSPLPAVVPTAECGDQDRLAQGRLGSNSEFLSDR
jgi:hypothetical protein